MKQFLWTLALLSIGFSATTQAAVSTLVADTKSGFVMSVQEGKTQRPPASLTKLMTLYLLFGALDNGVLHLSDELPISQNAASQPKSNIDLTAGDTITVEQAISALIIKSANDVAVVVAESLAQNEDDFATLMTQTARGLNMRDTIFKNASGLHHPDQVSTARDMAILTMSLIDHYPNYYPLFSRDSFSYHGHTYKSHNNVLSVYDGAEGLKTGFVSAGGYNIVATAKRGDTRIVGVVMGEESALKRDLRAIHLLDRGFHKVAIQQQAEKDGRLNGAFNPLNRKAFLSRSPTEIFLPTIKNSVSHLNKKPIKMTAKLTKKPKPTIPEIEQGDAWSIQVGAFKGQAKAHRIAQEALTMLNSPNKSIQTPQADNQFFRSRIHGFSSNSEAKQACRRLKDAHMTCLPIAPNT